MIRTASDFDHCAKCKSTRRGHSNLRQIGDRVMVPESRPIRGETVYTFYQCSRCGHLWQAVEGSGQFGHDGPYYYRLIEEPQRPPE